MTKKEEIRLIDANALLKRLAEDNGEVDKTLLKSGLSPLEKIIDASFNYFVLKIANTPTIKTKCTHGRWLDNIRGNYCKVCSECGYGFPTQGYAWSDCNRTSDERETAFVITDIMNYCPQCGAKMDSGADCQGKAEGFCDVCMEKRCEGGELY